MFEVTINAQTRAVTGVTRQLAANEFATAVSGTDTSGRTIGIVPLRPLKQLTSYMVVITDDVKDTLGNDATPDQTYFLAKRTSPLITPVTAAANPATCPTVATSTDPLLPVASACSLEPLRQLINSQEAAAASAGVPRADIVLSWVGTTQSITPVLMAARSITQPSTATLANSGQTTAAAGLPPVADIYIGVIPLKYYLAAPTAANPTGPLNGSWRAAPGAYNPPFNALGLDPNSTNLTFANPVPVAQSTEVAPVRLESRFLSVPRISGRWPKRGSGAPSARKSATCFGVFDRWSSPRSTTVTRMSTSSTTTDRW